jgi:uncharacterized membrane protein
MARRDAPVHIARMPAASPRLYMDAEITPNRSLSRRGLWILLGVLAAYNLLVMGFLLLIGAAPVPIFLGLDFAGLALAFHISNRRAGWAERVQVSADRVEVRRHRPPAAQRTVWSSPTAFTRVAVERGGEHDARVNLQLSRRSLAVGQSLSPEERESFGEALSQAIACARAERHPS